MIILILVCFSSETFFRNAYCVYVCVFAATICTARGTCTDIRATQCSARARIYNHTNSCISDNANVNCNHKKVRLIGIVYYNNMFSNTSIVVIKTSSHTYKHIFTKNVYTLSFRFYVSVWSCLHMYV